jgi:hypothetical protein
MPLQEARRQRRQRCGEGVVCLDLIAQGPHDHLDGRQVLENYSFGQLLVAGWGTIEPARQLRRLQHELGLYVETFLAAVYPTNQGRMVAIIAFEEGVLPSPDLESIETLQDSLPPHSLLIAEKELPSGARQGTAQTYAEVMDQWERLHRPFLAAADAHSDPVARIEAYRRTIAVDYACELAHQKLADVARSLARQKM